MNDFPAHDTMGRPDEEPQLAPLRDVERRHIERVLDEVHWNQRRAAKILGISRWALARRLQKFHLARPEEPTSS